MPPLAETPVPSYSKSRTAGQLLTMTTISSKRRWNDVSSMRKQYRQGSGCSTYFLRVRALLLIFSETLFDRTIVRCIPEWVPGAGFKKQVRIWAEQISQLDLYPHNWVKQQMVSCVRKYPASVA